MEGYGTNEGFTAYAEAAGYVFPDGTTEPQKTAARQRGSLFIDRYRSRFQWFSHRRIRSGACLATYRGINLLRRACPL